MLKSIVKMTHSLFGGRGGEVDNVAGNKHSLDSNHPSQQHTGRGDNVAGNKYQLQDLMPDDLKEISIEVFSDIGRGDIHSAKTRIKTVESTGRLGKESQPYLQALKLVSGLTDRSEADSIHPRISRALADSNSPKVKDMFLASLIRLRLILDDEAGAIQAYKSEKDAGFLSRCQYLEFLATKDELKATGIEPTGSDVEIISKIRGLLRVDEFSAALKLSGKAKNIYKDHDFEVVYLQALCKQINVDAKDRAYWFIEKRLKDQILVLCNNIHRLIVKSEGRDKRLFKLAVPILSYSGSATQQLSDICWRYVDKWQEDFPEFSALLYATEHRDYSYLEDDVKQNFLLGESESKKNELKRKVLSVDVLEVVDVLLALDHLDSSVVDKLIGKEISIENGDESIDKFVNLLLYSASSSEYRLRNKKDIPSLIQDFYGSGGDFKKINPFLIIMLARNLHRHDIYSEVCKILEDLLALEDPWLSPIMREYLVALFNSSQYNSFNKLLSKLHNDAQESSFYWSLNSHYQANKGELDKALGSIDKAIFLEPKSTQFLLQKARILLGLGNGVGEFLDDIDVSVVSLDDDDSIQLLAMMYHFVSFSKVEQVVVDLFLRDPVKASKTVSGLHLGFSISNKTAEEILPASQNVGDAIVGLAFNKGNKSSKAIVVENEKYSSNQYVLHSSSELAKRLMALSEGDIDRGWVEDLTLHTKIPPYVAAFQISCEIRQEMNDGSDAFFMLQVPEGGEELVAFMEDNLRRLSSRRSEEVFADEKIPLLMKGKAINSQEVCKSALELFVDPSISKMILPVESPGQESLEYITDVYTIIYACLTGLAKSFCRQNIKYTEETKKLLKEFRDTITSSEYMTLGLSESGHLVRTLGEDMERDFKDFIEGIDEVLSKITVVDDTKILESDLPQDLNILKGAIDDTVVHTIMACHSCRVSWLTIDNAIGGFVSNYGVDAYPMHILASKLSREVEFENKLNGLKCHVFADLPFPVHNEDILDLFFDFKATSLTVLRKIFEKHKSSILENRGLNSSLDGMPVYIAFKLQERRSAEVVKCAISLLNEVFRLQISRNNGYPAEYKLAMSIRQSSFKAHKAMFDIRKLIPFYENFIFGHFLNRQAVVEYFQEKQYTPYTDTN
ncbi:hypothetical protein KUV41_16885 [Halomonas sp. DP8Y7-1]|uniref:tetratricopeptide repeat protein n=1 Tax=Halomonas sp. DP8Y7-1 TaxID=2859078 RepID=UPI001C93B73E|nr:hypothetical protein [Halomonas sp. DP8Y7-1]MBY6031036.1 hypothetical protein [Halomonas sp. DP8Y7-1]